MQISCRFCAADGDLRNLRGQSPGGQRRHRLLQGFQRNGADAKPHSRVCRQRRRHDGIQLALAAADKYRIRGSPAAQCVRGKPSCQMQVGHRKFCAVLFYQRTGIGVTFGGKHLPLRRSQRHLYADAARPGADIPQNIPGLYCQLCQHGSAHLLLGHRRVPAQKGFVRQAGNAARQGAFFNQQHAQGSKFLLCQLLHTAPHKALRRIAQILPHGCLYLPAARRVQLCAKGCRILAAAGQKKGRFALAADLHRVAGTPVSRGKLPILPRAPQGCRQQLHAGNSRFHRIGQPLRVQCAAQGRRP